MALYTSDYLKGVVAKTPLTESTRMFSESKQRSSFDIFLAHSYLDKAAVEGLYYELSEKGFSVYVDWIVDPHLDRNNVTKETANHIRNRLRSSRSLLLAISENASVSKWVPWELGLVDGKTSNCAIVPVTEGSLVRHAYSGREYLSVYPFILKAMVGGLNRLWTVESAYSYTRFDDWIKGTKPSSQNTRLY